MTTDFWVYVAPGIIAVILVIAALLFPKDKQ